jgi:hypothetical protein
MKLDNGRPIVVLSTPTLFVTLPPLIWPHLLCFILPVFLWVVVCVSFLCISAAVMRAGETGDSTGGVAPSLVHATSTSRAQPHLGRTEAMPEAAPVARDSVLNVVYLDQLQAALDSSEKPESVLARLYTTDELLQKRVKVADGVSFAIISYRQVRSKDDQFTMDVRAFVAAVARAREAGVVALWLDALCYRQEGPYIHADFCAELATVMCHVAAVIWLPLSRTGASPSYQFRLWCSFEASVVARRRLPVYAAGQGLTRSQHLLRRFGSFMPALPGLSPPQEIRTLAYSTATWHSCARSVRPSSHGWPCSTRADSSIRRCRSTGWRPPTHAMARTCCN